MSDNPSLSSSPSKPRTNPPTSSAPAPLAGAFSTKTPSILPSNKSKTSNNKLSRNSTSRLPIRYTLFHSKFTPQKCSMMRSSGTWKARWRSRCIIRGNKIKIIITSVKDLAKGSRATKSTLYSPRSKRRRKA